MKELFDFEEMDDCDMVDGSYTLKANTDITIQVLDRHTYRLNKDHFVVHRWSDEEGAQYEELETPSLTAAMSLAVELGEEHINA